MIEKDKKFKLENFEGPLDLLLHLIKQKKMNILEISLVMITDQYIEYINDISNSFNLEIASEYLLLASQLLEIKSKYLMNSEIFIEKEEYEEDTQELMKRLVEYEKFKKLSGEMENILSKVSIIEKEDDDLLNFLEDEEEKLVNLITNGNDDISSALKNIIATLKFDSPMEQVINNKRISIEERREQINNILNKKSKINFLELFDKLNISKYFIAITLLVILEMSNSGKINIEQNNHSNNLEINRI